MAYGTVNGVANNLIDYGELVTQEAITGQMVTECREHADGIIDSRLAMVVSMDGLPLGEPPAIINGVSDDLTTYFILRRVFTGSEPNDSEWVDKFYTRPLELLDRFVESPGIAEAVSETLDSVGSNTENQDRIFTVSRESTGADGGTMDEW